MTDATEPAADAPDPADNPAAPGCADTPEAVDAVEVTNPGGIAEAAGTAGTAEPARTAGTAGSRRQRPWRWRAARWTGAVAGVLVLVAALIVAAPLGYLAAVGSVRPAAGVAAAGGDGLWLGHMWVDGSETGEDVAALAKTLRIDDIKDVFVHDGPLNYDGTLPVARDPESAWFIRTLHRLAPGVRVQAWLGQEVGTGPDQLDLASKPTQARVVASVRYALDVQGFDGVHFDFEPVPSGNWGYVQLLEQVRAATTERRKYLSIAVDQIEPAAGMMAVGDAVAGHAHFWSQGYLHQLAGLVDEVALMDYDTYIPTGRAYTGYTRMETGLALRAMPSGVHLLIGLPAYPPNPPVHRAGETVAAAITGVRLALGDGTPANAGVALYVDFASESGGATPADWTEYQDDWVSIPRSKG